MIYRLLFIIVNIISVPSISEIINTTEQVFVRGYKNISGKGSSITSSSTVYCDAAFACDSIAFITGNYVYCQGSNSCRNVSGSESSFIQPRQNTGRISCHGSNSCSNSNLRGTGDLYCHGDQSCSFSNIEPATNILAFGAYSLIYSVINSLGTGKEINIDLYGYHAGFGATITCEAADTCNIYCHGNACYMLYIECKAMNGGNCLITKTSNSTSDPIINISQFNASSFNLLYDSQSLTINNDQHCNQQPNSIKYDSYKAHYFGDDIVITADNPAPICCRGYQSCNHVTNIQSNTTSKEPVVCSGHQGCERVGTIVTNGPVFCEGKTSCGYTTIISRNIYCLGRHSCEYSRILKPYNIFCSSHESCRYTNITSNGNDLQLYLLGSDSGYNMILHCNEGDNCLVICGALDACTTSTFYGNVSIIYESEYGYGYEYQPTETHTNQPTQSTINPTYNPSESTVTSDSTYNPSESPINRYPTYNPSELPLTSDSTYNPSELTINPTYTQSPSPITSDPTRASMASTSTLILKNDICADGYQPWSEKPEEYCQPCSEYEAGTLGKCDRCGDGKEPNDDHTICQLCDGESIGIDGYCDVDCLDTEKVANEVHTECVEVDAWYETSEFEAILSIIGTLTGCSCIGGFIYAYCKRKLCFSEKTKNTTST